MDFPVVTIRTRFRMHPLVLVLMSTIALGRHGASSFAINPLVGLNPRFRKCRRSAFVPSPHTGRRNAPAAGHLSFSQTSDSVGEGDAGADDSSDEGTSSGIDVGENPALYRVRLPRAPGIEWGTDLSFAFVYVRELEPAGPADLSGEVRVGDQICELRPVQGGADEEGGSAPPVNLIGAPFDAVMDSFASLGKTVREVDLVFFRGTKEELRAACEGGGGAEEDEDITITIIENKGDAAGTEKTWTIAAKKGANVRQVLTDEGINVYQSFTRWTNCKGKQLCGTCIVNVADGAQNTSRKSMDEASTLRENPESYRLSCVTFAYGDVTVETFPPVNPAQWTR